MITLDGLTKRYGDVLAVDDLTTEIHPGRVTGFLGPNGAGKSTTMRMILGLDHPSAGRALLDGRHYRELSAPLRHVGALLEADAVHPGRSGRAHLLAMARSNGIPVARVDEVLGLVGLHDVARRRVREYSLGMKQRLGIAGALLGDPGILLFDEPVNGLDPDGVRWIRDLLRGLAAEGRTVLLSSHLMAEMELTADHLLVIGRGRLLADAPIEDVLETRQRHVVRAVSPEADRLAALLEVQQLQVRLVDPRTLVVAGAEAAEVGDLAHAAGLPLHALADTGRTLEDAYLQLTADSLEFDSGRRTDPVDTLEAHR